MSNERDVLQISEQDLYIKLEEEILKIPGVDGFTDEGFQYVVRGISQVLGVRGHKGLVLSVGKKKGIKVYVSLGVKEAADIPLTARCVQEKIKEILSLYTQSPITSIEVTITNLVK